MKTNNLVDINTWYAYKDTLGSEFILKNGTIFHTIDGKRCINIGIKKVASTDTAPSWISVMTDLFALSKWTKTFNISQAKQLRITYKTESMHNLIIYIRTQGINDGHNLPFFLLKPSHEWITRALSFKELQPPTNANSHEWGLTNIDALCYSFDFPKEGGEDHLSISDISLEPFTVYQFPISPSGIYKKTPFTPLHYRLKKLQEIAATTLDFLLDWTKMNGHSKIKQWLWNREFYKGSWNFLLSGYNQYLVKIVRDAFCGGTILDLGCGFGNYATVLKFLHYKKFIGVDISKIAIEKARSSNNIENTEFYSADIAHFIPECKIDCILMNEVVYYFDIKFFLLLLERYCSYLTDNGFIIMGIDNRWAFEFFITELQQKYPNLEVYNVDTQKNFELNDKDGSILLLRNPMIKQQLKPMAKDTTSITHST